MEAPFAVRFTGHHFSCMPELRDKLTLRESGSRPVRLEARPRNFSEPATPAAKNWYEGRAAERGCRTPTRGEPRRILSPSPNSSRCCKSLTFLQSRLQFLRVWFGRVMPIRSNWSRIGHVAFESSTFPPLKTAGSRELVELLFTIRSIAFTKRDDRRCRVIVSPTP